MKKVIMLIVALLGLAGCSSGEKTTYDVACITLLTGPFSAKFASDKIEGVGDYSPTYTLTLESGDKITVAKSNCAVGQPAPAAKDEDAVDPQPSTSPSATPSAEPSAQPSSK